MIFYILIFCQIFKNLFQEFFFNISKKSHKNNRKIGNYGSYYRILHLNRFFFVLYY